MEFLSLILLLTFQIHNNLQVIRVAVEVS
jgi:hypothetical protein